MDPLTLDLSLIGLTIGFFTCWAIINERLTSKKNIGELFKNYPSQIEKEILDWREGDVLQKKVLLWEQYPNKPGDDNFTIRKSRLGNAFMRFHRAVHESDLSRKNPLQITAIEYFTGYAWVKNSSEEHHKIDLKEIVYDENEKCFLGYTNSSLKQRIKDEELDKQRPHMLKDKENIDQHNTRFNEYQMLIEQHLSEIKTEEVLG